MLPSLPPGHTLHEYRFDKLLGVGGFGFTYLATDLNLHLPVAIKEYLPSSIAHRDAELAVHPMKEEDRPTFDWGLARFLDEARTLAAFHHPHIVRVMRYFQAHATAYMVMEFVDGAPLPDWLLQRRPLPQAGMVKLLRALAEGLDAIHRGGYLHRDIKPCNIYLRKDDSPVLLDFGAARSTAGGKGHTAILSFGYAPIEQYSESSVQGPWTDLYALGGVMYWLLTGKRPVDATARVRDDPHVPALQAGDRSAYSPEFLALIDWMLMMDERQRPQSAGALMARLDGLSEPVPSATSAVTSRDIPTFIPSPHPDSTPVSAEHLRDLESELARHIGPLASLLVKKATKKHTTFDALLEAVATEIQDETERSGFLRKVRGSTQPPSTPPSSPPSSPSGQPGGGQSGPVSFDGMLLERLETLLTHHIGVVAQVVVRRAARQARDEQELRLLVAEKIEDPGERRAFLKRALATSGRHTSS
ncbi:serine/threonine-protein kinase [Geothrix sp. PMB-07]|uniref:serine/threonine-protein kinase n=1 Tax=Geothrix sp. PMB-07 TaxID=3068640 RepID=UPI0027423813|nr:serine/threonine-protein kinase [Geothrix sp. PMB-07]WLT31027.1 serine/threonine-protein kinase [Geothrix sp. PMB-07]